MRRRDFLAATAALGCEMATPSPTRNPSPDGRVISDEVTSYPAGTPPALVDARTYPPGGVSGINVLGNGINVTLIAGKPRIVYELGGASRGGYMWYPAIKSFGHSGKIMAWAKLVDDTLENFHESSVAMMSYDFGQTWSESQRYDINLRNNGPCMPRFYDASTGRIYEWSQHWRPDPFGQYRDFRCHYTYYANSGNKRVTLPYGSTLRGLPFDITPTTPAVFAGTPMRNWWADIASEGTVTTMADGAWCMVVDCLAAGETSWSGFLVKSYDRGLTWDYVSRVGGANSGVTENALIRATSGKLCCFFRDFAPPATGACPAFVSTDSTGTAWGAEFYPSPTNWGLAQMGNAAPTSVTLQNGTHLVAAGRMYADEIMTLSINVDGIPDNPNGVWGWWDLTAHHNFYATNGDADDGGGDETNDYATANAGTGKIHKFYATTVGGPGPARQYSSSCYWGVEEIAPNEFMLMYDLTPQYRGQIGSTFQNMRNYIYCVHAKLVIG